MKSTNSDRPLGVLVPDACPALRPSRTVLTGQTVTLEPLQASHAEEMFAHIGGEDHGWLWDYMPVGPPADIEQLRSLLVGYEKSEDPLFWTIKVKESANLNNTSANSNLDAHTAVVGYISFLNIAPVHRTIEVGHVMYSPALQRTTAATEAVYLLLRHAFRDLGCRRVEWKCNNLNAGSKRAALRYGFTFEGLFRQHLIVKGRNRDTAWYSLLGSEWATGGVATAYAQWLHPTNFDEQGKQKLKLEECLSRAK